MPFALLIPCVGLLLPPTATASVALQWTGQRGDIALSVCALGLAGSWTVWQCWVTCRPAASFGAKAVRVRRARRPRPSVNAQPSSSSSFTSSLLEWLFGILQWWTRRSWAWQDRRGGASSSSSLSFTGTLGGLFDGCRGTPTTAKSKSGLFVVVVASRHWWPSCEFAVNVLCAVITGIVSDNRSVCDAFVVLVGALSAMLALLTLALRPHDTALDVLQGFVVNALAACGSFLALSLSNDEEQEDSSAFGKVMEALLWTQVGISMASLGITLLNVLCELLVLGVVRSHKGARQLMEGARRLLPTTWRREGQDDATTTTRKEDDNHRSGNVLLSQDEEESDLMSLASSSSSSSSAERTQQQQQPHERKFGSSSQREALRRRTEEGEDRHAVRPQLPLAPPPSSSSRRLLLLQVPPTEGGGAEGGSDMDHVAMGMRLLRPEQQQQQSRQIAAVMMMMMRLRNLEALIAAICRRQQQHSFEMGEKKNKAR